MVEVNNRQYFLTTYILVDNSYFKSVKEGMNVIGEFITKEL
mgnify:CR=1 FL=1